MFEGDGQVLEEIEAMIWRTGIRNRAAVERIMHLVRLYGGARSREWPPYRTRRPAVQHAAAARRSPR
jgi:hypothetical protein